MATLRGIRNSLSRAWAARKGGATDGDHSEVDSASHVTAFTGALLALLLLLLIAWRVDHWYEQQLRNEQRGAVAVDLATRGNALTTTLNRRLSRLQALHGFVQAQGSSADFADLFETYAAGLASGAVGMRNIAVAPGGVMRYVYPRAGNEAVIGYVPAIDDRLEVRDDVQQAILSGDIVLTGPIELVQGGMGLIARQAVLRNGRYWGLVTIVLDVPQLLVEAGVGPLPDEEAALSATVPTLQFALRDGSGRVFSGPSHLFFDGSPVANVQVGNEVWEMAAAPLHGWRATPGNSLLVYRVAAVAISLLLTLLVYVSIDRQTRLAQAVAHRTRALSVINLQLQEDIAERRRTEQALAEREEQYRGVFESTTDALLIFSLRDGRLVDFNPAAHQMHGYTAAEFRHLQPAHFIHPDHYDVFDRQLATVRAGKNFRAQGVNVRRDGTSFPVDVLGVVFTHRGQPHTLSVVRDITEEVDTLRLLEQRVAERTRELRSLLNTGRTLASTLQLEPLLAQILDQISGVVPSSGIAVLRLDESQQSLRLLAYRSPVDGARLPEEWPLEAGTLDFEVAREGKTFIVADSESESSRPLLWRDRLSAEYADQLADMRALMAVPLLYKERAVGMIAFVHPQAGYYNEHHADLALAFGSQAAVAIENARLYEQASSLAALQERQRLARELHDSVSQALYGIALGSRTARAMVNRAGLTEPQAAALAEPLDYVLSLAEAALTEMRALIFELRPETLQVEGLVAALQRQVEALQARHGIRVKAELGVEPALRLRVKEALYRVAQEALHNVVKHAGAGEVHIRLRQVKGTTLLCIRDDGRGFDAAQSFPGHLGLRSMRERIEALGGTLTIESTPGEGAEIRVEIV